MAAARKSSFAIRSVSATYLWVSLCPERVEKSENDSTEEFIDANHNSSENKCQSNVEKDLSPVATAFNIDRTYALSRKFIVKLLLSELRSWVIRTPVSVYSQLTISEGDPIFSDDRTVAASLPFIKFRNNIFLSSVGFGILV